jgi:hypothetical protein
MSIIIPGIRISLFAKIITKRREREEKKDGMKKGVKVR